MSASYPWNQYLVCESHIRAIPTLDEQNFGHRTLNLEGERVKSGFSGEIVRRHSMCTSILVRVNHAKTDTWYSFLFLEAAIANILAFRKQSTFGKSRFQRLRRRV